MATESFHNMLHTIQTCGLNFKMEITSFSATIVIKNSIAKGKNGNPLTLPLVNHNFEQTKSDIERQLLHQENAIKSL